MLGAAALASIAAMRAGAGLVTLGIPKSLNLTAQRKISPVVMTLPLCETKEKTISVAAYPAIQKKLSHYQAIAIGPGLTQNFSTQKLIFKIISSANIPIVIDADAINALGQNPGTLRKTKGIKIITPHAGEMSRLLKRPINLIENNRMAAAKNFAKQYHCLVVLKGHQTIIASPDGKTYINQTGNVGMATAGSGDVLTGMISAFLAQKIDSFEAAKTAVFLHGKAGDLAARQKSKASLLATDIIETLPLVLKKYQGNGSFYDKS